MQEEYFNIDKIIKIKFKNQLEGNIPVNDIILALKKEIDSAILKSISDNSLINLYDNVRNELINRKLLTVTNGKEYDGERI